MNASGRSAALAIAGMLLAATLAAARAVLAGAGAWGAPGSRPEGSSVVFDLGRPTLVVFLRGDSFATPDLLARLEAQTHGLGVSVALSVRLEGPVDAEVRRAARAVSDDVASDPAGREALLFGTRAGMAAVYAPSGRLLFRGELSGARGNSGLNALSRALAPWRGFAGGPVVGRAETL